MATTQEFVAAVVKELPEIRDDTESFDGLPYVQIRLLAEIAQRAKGDSNWPVPSSRCCAKKSLDANFNAS